MWQFFCGLFLGLCVSLIAFIVAEHYRHVPIVPVPIYMPQVKPTDTPRDLRATYRKLADCRYDRMSGWNGWDKPQYTMISSCS